MFVSCTQCSNALPLWVVKAGDGAMCPSCNADLIVHVFPALLESRSGIDPRDLEIKEDEASCFYHLSKRATETCAHCGRFVCALCTVDFGDAKWCPGCLASAWSAKKHSRLENRRVLWDSIALATATWPLVLIFWPALPGSLAAIFISIRYWKRPTSLIPRIKWRFIVAILIALTELVFFVAVIAATFIGLAARRQAGP
jgi:hypothetical protein